MLGKSGRRKKAETSHQAEMQKLAKHPIQDVEKQVAGAGAAAVVAALMFSSAAGIWFDDAPDVQIDANWATKLYVLTLGMGTIVSLLVTLWLSLYFGQVMIMNGVDETKAAMFIESMSWQFNRAGDTFLLSMFFLVVSFISRAFMGEVQWISIVLASTAGICVVIFAASANLIFRKYWFFMGQKGFNTGGYTFLFGNKLFYGVPDQEDDDESGTV